MLPRRGPRPPRLLVPLLALLAGAHRGAQVRGETCAEGFALDLDADPVHCRNSESGELATERACPAGHNVVARDDLRFYRCSYDEESLLELLLRRRVLVLCVGYAATVAVGAMGTLYFFCDNTRIAQHVEVGVTVGVGSAEEVIMPASPAKPTVEARRAERTGRPLAAREGGPLSPQQDWPAVFDRERIRVTVPVPAGVKGGETVMMMLYAQWHSVEVPPALRPGDPFAITLDIPPPQQVEYCGPRSWCIGALVPCGFWLLLCRKFDQRSTREVTYCGRRSITAWWSLGCWLSVACPFFWIFACPVDLRTRRHNYMRNRPPWRYPADTADGRHDADA